jgi:signal transduction histidine kinase
LAHGDSPGTLVRSAAMKQTDTEGLLVGGGFVTWVAVGIAQTAIWLSRHTHLDLRAVAWCGAYSTFVVGFLVAATGQHPDARRARALGLQTVAALVVLGLGRTGFEGALLVVIAGQAPLVVGERAALVWILAQTAAMVVVDAVSPFHEGPGYLIAVTYGGFQLFAFGAARLAKRETEARAELMRTHAELLATRELFADGTRAVERLRIARELHDGLGHHLTALSLQLEVARNVGDERARAPVEKARAITKALLGEVRAVVGTLREDVPLDLSHALRTLVAGFSRPRIHLEVERDVQVAAPIAHTIFRCVQEVLTNAVRHAHAENVYVAVASNEETVAVTARDDGRGAAQLKPGHGLSGLRERIEGMGGTVEIEARKGAGLTLRALLPHRAGGAP